MSGSERMWAPDAARGWTLLLIALANAPFWVDAHPRQSGQASSWELVRGLLVDQREYALFALLLGFGAASLSGSLRRRGLSWQRTACALALRGAVLMALGALHAMLFQADVLGAYGLALALLAPVLAMRAGPRRRRLVLGLAAAWALLAMMLLLAMSTEGIDGRGGVADWDGLGVGAPSAGVQHWLLNSPGTLLTTMVAPCALLGTLLVGWEPLRDPLRHRRLLACVAAAGLLLGAFGALPHAGPLSGHAVHEPQWALALHVATGVAGAFGWLALAALALSWPWAGPARAALARLGANSLTGYLQQTAVFGALYAAGALRGAAPAEAAAWACLAWLLTLLWSEARRPGSQGWAERLTRLPVLAATR